MQSKSLSVSDFLEQSRKAVVLDVRSPGEYQRGHIPGAIAFPLFSNEERSEIGTLYKQASRQEAILKGLEIIGPKMPSLVKEAAERSQGKPLLLHCWRGGMRSGSLAWLLATAGMKVSTLQGGYKAFRQWVHQVNAAPRKYLLIGGKTGSGKTEVLRALAQMGSQTVDLEALASHQGSAFGGIDKPAQPSTEHFENLLAFRLQELDNNQPVWMEDESRTIGSVFLGDDFISQMKKSPVAVLQLPPEARIQHLVASYGQMNPAALIQGMDRIRKRLGGQHHQAAVKAIEDGDLATAAAIALQYYDKTYTHGLSTKTDRSTFFDFETLEPLRIAKTLLSWSTTLPYEH